MQFKITFLIWACIIFSNIVFILGTIPFQRAASLERMNNEASDITNSISQVTTTAIMTSEYGFAVEHCRGVLKKSQSLVYIVITKNDGFSLIHRKVDSKIDTLKDDWKEDTLKGYWKPENLHTVRSEIQKK